MSITTIEDIQKKKESEEVQKKPLLKKLTPQEIKARRVEIEKIELEIHSNKKIIEIWEKELEEGIPNKRQRLEIRKKTVENEAKECDIESHKRIIKQSERS